MHVCFFVGGHFEVNIIYQNQANIIKRIKFCVLTLTHKGNFRDEEYIMLKFGY